MGRNISTKKKIFLILSCMWIIITFSVIRTTYAKYVTNLIANANISISYWNILVNTQDILENSDFSNRVNVVLQGNDYTKPGVLVPNGTGYFDLNIDSSEVSLPFSVKVETSVNESSALKKDFKITGYSLDNGANITSLESNETSFTYDINKDIDTTTIRIYTSWLDDGLPSEDDTLLGISNEKAILDVNLSFSQITE